MNAKRVLKENYLVNMLFCKNLKWIRIAHIHTSPRPLTITQFTWYMYWKYNSRRRLKQRWTHAKRQTKQNKNQFEIEKKKKKHTQNHQTIKTEIKCDAKCFGWLIWEYDSFGFICRKSQQNVKQSDAYAPNIRIYIYMYRTNRIRSKFNTILFVLVLSLYLLHAFA